MRKLIKRASLALLKRAGVFRRVARSPWRRSRLVILGYHGISIDDEHLWDPTLYMSLDDFTRRLDALLAGGFRVLRLAEGLKRLEEGTLPPKSVVLTFDDGSYDFYARAWPALVERGLPATAFLTTFYCEHNRPVFNTTSSYLLWKARGRVIEGGLDLRTPESRRQAWLGLLARAERDNYTTVQKDRLLERLAASAGVNYAVLLRKRLLHIMNPAEVRSLHAQGLDVQLHTHRHRTPVDRELFLRELRDNRTHIQRITGDLACNFCYPSGETRTEFLPWLSAAGVQYAVTCEPGLAAPDSHPLLLPRFVDHANLSQVEFESCVSGFGLLLPNEGRTAPIPQQRERAAALSS